MILQKYLQNTDVLIALDKMERSVSKTKTNKKQKIKRIKRLGQTGQKNTTENIQSAYLAEMQILDILS